jgi:hypothetical protein
MANSTLTSIVEVPAIALQESMNSIIMALPKVVTALIIILLGWLIAKISEIAIKKLLIATQVDEWLKKMKLKESLYNLSISNTLSIIVKYYIIIIFLKEASVRAGLVFLAELIGDLINAIPNIMIGISIAIIALVFADFVRKRIKESLVPFKDQIGEIVYGIIVFFAIVMALPKFGLTNTSLIEDSFKYLVLGLSLGISIAIGIGFGWAIKEGPAKEFFKKRTK